MCVADKGAAVLLVPEGAALVGGHVTEVGDAAVVPGAGHVAPSRRCVWRLNVPGAVESNQRDSQTSGLENGAYSIFLDAFNDTLDDIFNDIPMIPVRFVIPKTHHPPVRDCRIPMHFDDTIIDLVARQFQSGGDDSQSNISRGWGEGTFAPL